MREILFRGKRVDNGEWVYGGILQTENWTSIFTYKDYQGGINEPPSCDVEDYEVIPSTIGQYTGLTDKNGKKIFEGDIVRNIYNNEELVGKVEYSEGSFGVRFADGSGQFLCFFNNSEVIGNIYDNKEILDVK